MGHGAKRGWERVACARALYTVFKMLSDSPGHRSRGQSPTYQASSCIAPAAATAGAAAAADAAAAASATAAAGEPDVTASISGAGSRGTARNRALRRGLWLPCAVPYPYLPSAADIGLARHEIMPVHAAVCPYHRSCGCGRRLARRTAGGESAARVQHITCHAPQRHSAAPTVRQSCVRGKA